MHPAPSIVLFTVLSGLGLGQMVWLGLGLGWIEGRSLVEEEISLGRTASG